MTCGGCGGGGCVGIGMGGFHGFAPVYFGSRYSSFGPSFVPGENTFNARVEVMLRNVQREAPETGVMGWLAGHSDMFAHVEETMDYRTFLDKIEPILREHGMMHVIRGEVDWNPIYSEPSEHALGEPTHQDIVDNLDSELAKLSDTISARNGNLLGFTVISRTDIMHLTTKIDFWRRHKPDQGSFGLHIVGVPSLYFKQEGEDDVTFEKRLYKLRESDPTFKEAMNKCRSQMQGMEQNFKDHVAETFDISAFKEASTWESN